MFLLTGSPMGATCVDGTWSPNKIPTCVQKKHPGIRQIDNEIEQNQTYWIGFSIAEGVAKF